MTERTEEQLPLAVATPWTPTGDVRVDSAVDLLSGLSTAALAEHAEVFEDIHRRLQHTLSDATGS